MPIAFPVDAGDRTHHPEPGMPVFLDGGPVYDDDLADWWLDLGAVYVGPGVV